MNGLIEKSMMEDGSRSHLRSIHQRGLLEEEERVNERKVNGFEFSISLFECINKDF